MDWFKGLVTGIAVGLIALALSAHDGEIRLFGTEFVAVVESR